MPGGRFSGPGDHSGPISGHFRRSRARPPICDLNIVTLPQLRLLRHQHCVLREDRCLFLRQRTCLLLRPDRCLLLRQDRCLLLRQDRCLLLRQGRCLLLQEQTSVLCRHTMFKSRTSQLWQGHNVQVSDRRSGPKSTKMVRNGSRMVARS